MILEIPVFGATIYILGTKLTFIVIAPDGCQNQCDKMDDTRSTNCRRHHTGSPSESQYEADREYDLKQVADGVKGVGSGPMSIDKANLADAIGNRSDSDSTGCVQIGPFAEIIVVLIAVSSNG